MKIFEIIPQLSSGGAERFTIDLCNELSKEHDVTLVVLHSVEKFGFYADELSPKVHLVSMNKRMGFDAMLPYPSSCCVLYDSTQHGDLSPPTRMCRHFRSDAYAQHPVLLS